MAINHLSTDASAMPEKVQPARRQIIGEVYLGTNVRQQIGIAGRLRRNPQYERV